MAYDQLPAHLMTDQFENAGDQLHWSRGLMERVDSCPACGSSSRAGKPLVCTDHRTDLRIDEWRLHRCASCRSLFLDPRPTLESLPKAYQSYYTHSQDDEQPATSGFAGLLWRLIHGYLNHRFGLSRQPSLSAGVWLFRLMLPLRMKLDYYGRHLYSSDFPQRGRLLDVGCGNGAFLQRAVEMGWRVNGLDPDPAAVAVCTNQRLDVVRGTLLDSPSEWVEKFDVVTMSHSIEHVTQPGAELKQVYRLLRPGGVLWLACPNPDSLGARFYAQAWRGLHPPYHLVIPSAPQLFRMLVEAGFTDLMPIRRGAHARWMIRESAENARHIGDLSMQTRALLAPLIRAFADATGSMIPGGAEETLVMARRPRQS
ncbi:methyltransferase domain-containing protein [Rhodocyclaceae bacterium SMB388]